MNKDKKNGRFIVDIPEIARNPEKELAIALSLLQSLEQPSSSDYLCEREYPPPLGVAAPRCKSGAAGMKASGPAFRHFPWHSLIYLRMISFDTAPAVPT